MPDDETRSTPEAADPPSYLAEVERLFAKHARRAVPLSARDIECVERWHEEDVPIGVIARALAHAARTWADDTAPRSLDAFVGDRVDTEMARHRKAHEANLGRRTKATTDESAPDPASDEAYESLSEVLVSLGSSASDSRVREALRRAYHVLSTSRETSPRPPAWRAWRRVRQTALDAIGARLTAAERGRVREAIEQSAASLRAMSARAASRHRAALFRREIARMFDIEPLMRFPGSRPSDA